MRSNLPQALTLTMSDYMEAGKALSRRRYVKKLTDQGPPCPPSVSLVTGLTGG
jgi:hypothetical protein